MPEKNLLVVGALRGYDLDGELLTLAKQFDKVIILGDYATGPVGISDTEIGVRFMRLLNYKRMLGSKLVLLLGAGDIPYIFTDEGCWDDARSTIRKNMNVLFLRSLKYFQIAYQYKNYLFSHGGFTNLWVKENAKLLIHNGMGLTNETFADCINSFVNVNRTTRKLVTSNYVEGVYLSHQGPVQSDKFDMERDMLKGFKQVTGTDKVNSILTVENDDKSGSVTYINCLQTNSPQFLTLTL